MILVVIRKQRTQPYPIQSEQEMFSHMQLLWVAGSKPRDTDYSEAEGVVWMYVCGNTV